MTHGKIDRRTFLELCALSAASGCASPFGLGKSGRGSSSPDYWCTWATQSHSVGKSVKLGLMGSSFHGDQGIAWARDNLNERILFDGWAKNYYPSVRGSLYCVLDDGWDVPYGENPGKAIEPFGSLVADAERFPSFAGTPAARMRGLNRALQDLGWRGAGLWVAAQAKGEGRGARLNTVAAREDLKRKLGWCAEAGIGYLKVDWGVHSGSTEYRRLLSEAKDAEAPDVAVEHCAVMGAPFNGLSFGADGTMTCTGRAAEDAPWREQARQILCFADVLRIYDLMQPLTLCNAAERTQILLRLGAADAAKALINVEDEIYLGAALGCTFGAMRSPDSMRPYGGRDWSDCWRRTTEVVRATNWRRYAPAFAAADGSRTCISQETVTDDWFFEAGTVWWKKIYGKHPVQSAPARIARSLPLPGVTVAGDERPLVCVSRHPNGALAIGALPRIKWPRGRFEVPADIRLDVVPGRHLAVFGSVASVRVRDNGAVRVVARDLAQTGDAAGEDITRAVVRTGDGHLVLPGDVLNRIGAKETRDLSSPACHIEFLGSAVAAEDLA